MFYRHCILKIYKWKLDTWSKISSVTLSNGEAKKNKTVTSFSSEEVSASPEIESS